MDENEISEAHWSATPVEVDAEALMASLVEGIARGEAAGASGGFGGCAFSAAQRFGHICPWNLGIEMRQRNTGDGGDARCMWRRYAPCF